MSVQRRHSAPLAAVLLAGCGTLSYVPRHPHRAAQSALEAFAASRQQLRSLRAEARVDQRGTQGRVRGTVWMFVERPDRVRFDVMTQFGPASTLTSAQGRFALNDHKERRFLKGPSCSSNIARLLGITLSAAEVTAMLLGQVVSLAPARAHAVSRSGIRWDPRGFYRIVLGLPDRRRKELDLALPAEQAGLPLARQKLRLRRVEVFDAQGRSLWRVAYQDYRIVALEGQAARSDGVVMPFRVHFEHQDREQDVLVRFKDMTLNPQIPTSAFQQRPPPGRIVRWVTCNGAGP